MRKAQVGLVVGVVFLLITFIFLSFFWPLIQTMVNNVVAASSDLETQMLWRTVPFWIILLAILGMFYYNQQAKAGNIGKGGG